MVFLGSCTVKKVTDFPVPSRDVTLQTLVIDIPSGDGKIEKNFFYSVVRHVTGNDQDYLGESPERLSDICASLKGPL